MPQRLVVAGVHSVLNFVAKVNNYTLFENTNYGTYKITTNGKTVANPTTEEAAWSKLIWLSGKGSIDPSCAKDCRVRDCENCERYY